MIVPMSLLDAVCDFLEKEIAPKFKLKTVDIHGSETKRHPQIIRSGWALPKSIDGNDSSDEIYPCLIPRIRKLSNIANARESVVVLRIMVGIYDPGVYTEDGKFVDDGSGFRDFWNLIETVRQELFTRHTLDNKFRIHDDFFESELIEGNVYPYWEGYCDTKWDVIYPLPHLGEKLF